MALELDFSYVSSLDPESCDFVGPEDFHYIKRLADILPIRDETAWVQW